MCSNWWATIWFDLIPPRKYVWYFILLMYMPSGRKTIASVPGSRREKNLTCCRKPCSTSGFVRRQLFKRYYSDSSWSYLFMFKFAPQVCKKGSLLRSFSSVCWQLLTMSCVWLEQNHTGIIWVQNYSKNLNHLMSSWNNFLFWTQVWLE